MGIIKAVAAGKLADFPGAPDVYVLDNGKRVITTRGAVGALTGGGAKAANLERYVAGLPKETSKIEVVQNIAFLAPTSGGKQEAHGIDAEWFVDLCQAYVTAGLSGKLRASQTHLAMQSAIIMNATAKVGVVALIDEACGYRPEGEHPLNDLWGRIVREQARDWERMWEREVAIALAPLYQKEMEPGVFPVWMKGIIGNIYDMVLGKDVTARLRELCPNPGGRHTRHQHLTEETRTYLRSMLPTIVALANTITVRPGPNARQVFWRKLRRIVVGEMLQMELLDSDEE